MKISSPGEVTEHVLNKGIRNCKFSFSHINPRSIHIDDRSQGAVIFIKVMPDAPPAVIRSGSGHYQVNSNFIFKFDFPFEEGFFPEQNGSNVQLFKLQIGKPVLAEAGHAGGGSVIVIGRMPQVPVLINIRPPNLDRQRKRFQSMLVINYSPNFSRLVQTSSIGSPLLLFPECRQSPSKNE